MFRISFVVEDKNLPIVLHGVAGKVRGLEVVPVSSVSVDATGGIKPVVGNASDLFVQHIRTHKLTSVTRADAKSWLTSIGRAPQGAGHIFKTLVASGVLRKPKGRNTGYEVIHGKS